VAEDLTIRTQRWRESFDKETMFFRGRDNSGAFLKPFDQYMWVGPSKYTEGGPWQYRFYVPFDGPGLREMYEAARPAGHGEPSRLCTVLHDAMTSVPAFHLDPAFHEAAEMVINCFGQYAHNNQPSHHILYMFAHGGCGAAGQKYIQHTLATLYGEFGYSGDEDNGEMSSWYVLSALGLYALAPGSGEYQIGAPPLFPRMVVRRQGGKDLIVERSAELRSEQLNAALGTEYLVADRALWNGEELDLRVSAANVQYRQLLAGGTLSFA